MTDMIETAITRHIRAYEEHCKCIDDLKKIELSDPMTEEQWSLVCKYAKNENDILEACVKRIFPEAKDVRRQTYSSVNFSLYGYDCKLPVEDTPAGVKFFVNDDWTYGSDERVGAYVHSHNLKHLIHLKHHFNMLDASESLSNVIDQLRKDNVIRVKLPKILLYVLWRFYYSRLYNDRARNYVNARLRVIYFDLQEMRKSKNIKREKLEVIKHKLLPTLHSYSSDVEPVAPWGHTESEIYDIVIDDDTYIDSLTSQIKEVDHE